MDPTIGLVRINHKDFNGRCPHCDASNSLLTNYGTSDWDASLTAGALQTHYYCHNCYYNILVSANYSSDIEY